MYFSSAVCMSWLFVVITLLPRRWTLLSCAWENSEDFYLHIHTEPIIRIVKWSTNAFHKMEKYDRFPAPGKEVH
jgi:hypothetical protein